MRATPLPDPETAEKRVQSPYGHAGAGILGVLTVADLMSDLDYSETTIRELVRDGLPTMRLVPKGDVRFLVGDVRGWLKGLSKVPEGNGTVAWPRRQDAVRSQKGDEVSYYAREDDYDDDRGY